MNQGIRLKIRLDYRGEARSRFLLGTRNSHQSAEEKREQKVNLLRNLPMQGIQIEEVDLHQPTYSLYDDSRGTEVAYAPAVLTLRADSLEDVLRFLFWEEFRLVEIIEPEEITFTRQQLERLLFKIGEGIQGLQTVLERRASGRP
jgi:hypothetical protein